MRCIWSECSSLTTPVHQLISSAAGICSCEMGWFGVDCGIDLSRADSLLDTEVHLADPFVHRAALLKDKQEKDERKALEAKEEAARAATAEAEAESLERHRVGMSRRRGLRGIRGAAADGDSQRPGLAELWRRASSSFRVRRGGSAAGRVLAATEADVGARGGDGQRGPEGWLPPSSPLSDPSPSWEPLLDASEFEAPAPQLHAILLGDSASEALAASVPPAGALSQRRMAADDSADSDPRFSLMPDGSRLVKRGWPDQKAPLRIYVYELQPFMNMACEARGGT